MVAREYEDSVFVNCPFDKEYQPLFDAIIFAIHKCRFLPRCAKEVDDASQNRLDKIVQIIRDCRYGIHDISRTTPNEQGLPRFNMPLELGVFLGAMRFGGKEQKQKRCLIFDRDPYRYRQFISDLAGQDVHAHNDDVRTAVVEVRNWLTSMRASIPSGGLVWEEYEDFQQALPEICAALSLRPPELTYWDYVRAVDEWLLHGRPENEEGA